MATPPMNEPPSTPVEPHGRQPAEHDRRERARAGVIVVLTIVLIVFAVINLNSVKVDWIVGSGHAPLIIVIAISMLVGLVLGRLSERLTGRRRRRR